MSNESNIVYLIVVGIAVMATGATALRLDYKVSQLEESVRALQQVYVTGGRP